MPTEPLDAAGHALHPLPERALWWPAARTLLVADLHLGKGAAFRAAGQPLPRGSSAGDLARLAELIARHGAERLVVLGDFWHHASGRSAALLAHLHAFRAAHTQLDWLLVRGNHDAQAGDPPAALRIAAVADPWPLAPGLVARHAPLAWDTPAASADAAVVLAGHLHPAALLRTRADRLRLPCFVWQPGRQLVLPAFGALTGHATLDALALAVHGARLAVCAPDAVRWL